MDWMLTRCEEVDEEGLSGNEADSEDEGYNDEIADPDNRLLNMVCCFVFDLWSISSMVNISKICSNFQIFSLFLYNVLAILYGK